VGWISCMLTSLLVVVAARATSGKKGQKMWDTLEHAGVLFPPMYEPHGVKLKYENKPVDLSPEEEEVASMFAAMKDTEYATKPVFLKNFWNDFREVRIRPSLLDTRAPRSHSHSRIRDCSTRRCPTDEAFVVTLFPFCPRALQILSPANRKLLQSLELCDFTAIANYQLEVSVLLLHPAFSRRCVAPCFSMTARLLFKSENARSHAFVYRTTHRAVRRRSERRRRT
jgi:hypothetical protein